MKRLAVISALCLFIVPAVALAQPGRQPEPTGSGSRVVSLLKDRNFELGVYVQSPDQQDRSNVGTLYPFAGTSSKSPAWTLAQWHGADPILPADPVKLSDGGMEYKNAGKRVVFGPGPRLILGLKGSDRAQHTSKYVRKLKTTLGIAQDTWVPGGDYHRLSDMEQLRVSATARLLHAESPPDGNPRGTAAVGFIGLHIRNVDPDRRDLIYFVMPLYDSRQATRRPVRTIDKATGGRFYIYGTGNEALIGKQSFHDKEWITIDKDILPLVKDALVQARKSPKFADYSADLADYTISLMSIRWEMSADMNVEMEFKNFDLAAVIRPATPTLSLVADPDRVPKGKSARITWSASNVAGDCALKSKEALLAKGNAGARQTEPLEDASVIALECTDAKGATEKRAVKVRALNYACVITADPPAVKRGEKTVLAWESERSAENSIAPDIGKVPASGTRVVEPITRTNYIVTVRRASDMRPQQCNVVVPVIQ